MKIKFLRLIKMLSKFIVYGMILQTAFYTVILASEGKAQRKNVKEVEVTVKSDYKSLNTFFKDIERQTGFKFAYSDQNVRNDRINGNLKPGKRNFYDVLLELSEINRLKFKQINNSISVDSYRPEKSGEKQVFELAQPVTITGRVTSDDSPDGLPGVNVVIKGTSSGTVTDINGYYTIDVPSGESVLVFSSVGYVLEEVAVGNRSVIDMFLIPDITALDEIVVVGYGSQKKENLTGAVATLDAETFEARPVQNAAQMLQGTVPGLNISQSAGGSLENRPTVNIRGLGTIGEGSSGGPLILIDGMEGDLFSINPQDIESVSVLKDAAASSIYGSRAPFGVILITTKKGEEGKAQINYNNSFRVSKPMLLPDMMNSFDFATYFNDASTNGGGGLYFDDERMQRIKDYMDGKITETTIVDPNNSEIWFQGYSGGNANVDWFDALFRDQAFSQEHNLSMSGGSEKIQYYVSGQFLDQDGLMVFNRDFFKRYTATAKINAELTDWASIGYNTRYIREDYERPSFLTNSLFQDLARQGWPVVPLYDPNGYLFSSPSPALKLRDGGRDIHQNDWLYQQLQLTLEPVKNWKIFAKVNYRSRNNFRHWDIQRTYNHDVNGDPYVYDKTSYVHEDAYRENYNNNSIYTEYSKYIDGGHFFKIMAGFQSELNKFRDLSVQRDGIIVPELPVLDLTSGTDIDGKAVTPFVSGQYQNWSTVGYFGRLNYDYNERYLLELNLRYDGTSRFRADSRWLWSPSVSAGWNIAKENFWKPLTGLVSTFKLRGSYGELGNQNTTNLYPTYVTLPVVASNGTWLVDGIKPNTATAPGLVSQSLTWETIRSWNAGVDLALFSGNITTSFDYYTRFTDNMVGPAPELPLVLGTEVPKTNNTNLKTYGFDWELAWNGQLNSETNLSVRFLLSDAQTEILEYPNPTGSLDKYRKGQKVGEIWGYETTGIAKSQDEMNEHLASLPNGGQNSLGSQFSAGDVMYKDINGDGKIDPGSNTVGDHGDLKVIGNTTPRYRMGLDLGATWKGFDFRAFFQGVLKRDYFQDSYYFWGAGEWGIWWSSGLEAHKDYFRADADHPLGQNLDAYYPRPLFGANAAKNQQVQTKYLQDASYIRLKNLQIGYTLPASLTERLALSKVRFYVSGENLFTITQMSEIFDPETIGGGWGGAVYPLSKVYSAGLSVNF